MSRKLKSVLLFRIVAFVAVAAALITALFFGTESRKDPLWLELDSLMMCNGLKKSSLRAEDSSGCRIVTLKERLDSLEMIYKIFHDSHGKADPCIELLSDPFLPDWEYNKLKHYLSLFMKNNFVVLSGVSGSGKTTLIDRLAKFIAGSKSRIKRLTCVEKLEVEYHKQWIGYYERGKFMPGKFLKMLERCHNDTNNNYVFIIDDIDKIYPATFFGSDLWEELDNPKRLTYIDGYPHEIFFPENLFLISVTHSGVASTVELNNEHFRRLGSLTEIKPNYIELILYLKSQSELYLKSQSEKGLNSEHLKKMIYCFIRVNEYIDKNYGASYMLGQWSTLRKLYKPDDFEKFLGEFIFHVNSFKPSKMLARSDLEDIVKTADDKGTIPNSSPLNDVYASLTDMGLFSELTVALSFALFSGLFGWVILARRRKLLSKMQSDIMKAATDFADGKTDYESSVKAILMQKTLLEQRVNDKQIKYEDAIYLFLYINEQIKTIENTNKMNLVSRKFMKTFDSYIEDGVLTDDEYTKLINFLEDLKNALTPEIYYKLKDRIDTIYKSQQM